MTAALTPTLALAFVTALSADIRAAVVLDSDGERLAGPEPLARAARSLPDAPQLEGTASTGGVYAASDERHTIVVVTGPFALPNLTRHDLRTALSALGGQTPPNDPPTRLPAAAVSALVNAAQDGFRRHRAN
jgi:hypothetical protein